MGTFDKALEALALKYMAAWDVADEEKRMFGKVSRKTENLLIGIEKELTALCAE